MSEIDNDIQGRKHKIFKLALWSMILGIFGFFSPFFSLMPVLLRSSGFVAGIIKLFLTNLPVIPILLCGSGLTLGIMVLRKSTWSRGLKMGRVFAVAGLIISLLGFCLPILFLVHSIKVISQAQVTKIDDATSKTTLILSPEIDANNIDGISILVTGYIGGSATINIRNGEEDYFTRHVPKGLVFLKIEGDWYSDQCRVEYEHTDVHSGNLTIRYVLSDDL